MEAWDPTPDRAGDQRVQKRAGLEDFVQKKPRKHSSKGLLRVQPTSAIRGEKERAVRTGSCTLCSSDET